MARSTRTGVIAATLVVLGHIGVLVVLLARGGYSMDVRWRGESICLCAPITLTPRPVPPRVPVPREARSTAAVPVAPAVPVERPNRTAVRSPIETRALDLRVPPELLAAPELEQTETTGWVFDRKLARQLDTARKAAAERQLLAARRRAREGVSSDDYQRSSALGEKVKTDAGCFDLRPDPDNGGTRWWREACTDIQKSPWEQPPLPEYPESPQ